MITRGPEFSASALSKRTPLQPSTSWAIELAMAATLAAFGFFDLVYDVGDNGAELNLAGGVAISVACIALIFRRARPLQVMLVVGAAWLVIAYSSTTEVALSLPSAVALYAFCRSSTRRTSIIAAAGASIVATVTVLIVGPSSLVQEILIEVLIVLLAAALAEIVRTGEARTADRISAETTERMHAERLRLARDLHDVVAHSLSNIAIQSGVASRLIDTNPDHAKKALDIINEVGRNSLDELRSFLGLLRSDDDMIDPRPTPDHPRDIDALVAETTAAGANVELVQHGEFSERATGAVVLAAYRIIQESLTNVARHAGPVPSVVELTHYESYFELRIRNSPGQRDRPSVPSTGVGIIGMKERAEAVGGQLTASPCDAGGFTVYATLPYDRQELTAP